MKPEFTCYNLFNKIFYWPKLFFSGLPKASPHFRHCILDKISIDSIIYCLKVIFFSFLKLKNSYFGSLNFQHFILYSKIVSFDWITNQAVIIYRFWLPIWYLQTLFRYRFKHFCYVFKWQCIVIMIKWSDIQCINEKSQLF
jgi:hypothetical protein